MKTKTDKTSLIPKLRFPEFQNSGGWEVKRLGEVFTFISTNSYSRKQLNYENGVVKNIHYGDIHTKFKSLFDITKELVPFINIDVIQKHKIREEQYCIEGDLIFADASEDLNDIGKCIEIINTNDEKIVAGLHTLHARQKKKFLTLKFGAYLFQSSLIRGQIQKESQGTKVLGVSASRIEKIKLLIPSLPEQQKIADFLSNLDEWIAAEEEKLTLLQQHKKGLLQNLFPREGETTPRLRFPEFQNSGEWEVKRLGEVVEILKGKGISKSDITEDGDIPCIRYGEIYTHYGEIIKSVYSFTSLPINNLVLSRKNDVIVPASGETHEDIAKGSCVKIEGVALGGDINIIRSSILEGDFLAYYISHGLRSIISKVAQGVSVIHLYPQQLKRILIKVPSKAEQQKIADCLSALDEQIEAQQKKIELLREHKKGLLQQLFPSL